MKPVLSILIIALLIAFVSSMLCIVGESRPDAYISTTILLYFIYTSIDTSLRKRSKLLYLDIAFIVIFVGIVSYRVLQILGMV